MQTTISFFVRNLYTHCQTLQVLREMSDFVSVFDSSDFRAVWRCRFKQTKGFI
jgi:hypothetical protein